MAEDNDPLRILRTKVPSPSTTGLLEVIRYLGGGKAGHVYEARGENQRVALKIYKEWVLERPESKDRIEREANIAGLSHPHICQILGSGRLPVGGVPRPYLLMEFVSGGTLTKLIERVGGPLPYNLFLMLATQLVEAVRHLHARDIVHRDIKPDNLLVDDVGHRPRAVLADFGVVGNLVEDGATLTNTADFLGTIRYSAPEWIFRFPPEAAVSVAVDTYSIGATLLEMMTGRSPYDDIPNFAQLTFRIRTAAPAVDSPTYPPDVVHLIRRMLARDPQRRPDLEEVESRLRTRVSNNVEPGEDGTEGEDPLARLESAFASREDILSQRDHDDATRHWNSLRAGVRAKLRALWERGEWGEGLKHHPMAKLSFIRAAQFEDLTGSGDFATVTTGRRYRNLPDLVSVFPDFPSWSELAICWSFIPFKPKQGPRPAGVRLHYFVSPVDLAAERPLELVAVRVLSTVRDHPSFLLDTARTWSGDAEAILRRASADRGDFDRAARRALATANHV